MNDENGPEVKRGRGRGGNLLVIWNCQLKDWQDLIETKCHNDIYDSPEVYHLFVRTWEIAFQILIGSHRPLLPPPPLSPFPTHIPSANQLPHISSHSDLDNGQVKVARHLEYSDRYIRTWESVKN